MHSALPLFADIQMAVVGTHTAHTTAKLAMEGEFTHARMNALVSQRLMQRTRYNTDVCITTQILLVFALHLLFFGGVVYSQFQRCVFHDHAFSVISKNFLWVEFHANFTAQNTLKSRSYKGTFAWVSYLQNAISMKIHGIRNIRMELNWLYCNKLSANWIMCDYSYEYMRFTFWSKFSWHYNVTLRLDILTWQVSPTNAA